MEALSVNNLSKDFSGLHAVRNLSFSVTVGERLAIIGPNGAGKTTLFNLLSGQLQPTRGTVYFFGQDITRMPAYRRVQVGLARSFQIASLFPNLTVLTNILLALQGTRSSRFRTLRAIRSDEAMSEEARAILEPLNLWDRRDEITGSISYGEQRKLEIALSLASRPKLILLDEPSCGLTATESAEITTRLRTLGDTITVVMIAHDMDLVFGVAQRLLVLHYGELLCHGSCEDIRTNATVKEIYMGTQEMKRKCSN
jgi:branched-chain amino acid transport system ATP-binding protein